MHLAILGDGFGNTDSEALIMGESWGGYGCKEFSGRYPEKSANLVALLRYL